MRSMDPSGVEDLRQEVRAELQPVVVAGRKSVQASTCAANKKVKATGEYWIRRIMRAGDEAVLRVKRAKKEKKASRGSSSAAAPSTPSYPMVPTLGPCCDNSPF